MPDPDQTEPASRPPATDGYSTWRGETYRYGKPLTPVSPEEMEREPAPLDVSYIPTLPRKRGIFLPFTVALGAIAVSVESTTHILAGFYADPLPHFGYPAAYLLAIAAPVYVNRVVRKGNEATATERGVAVTANAVSLLMAGMMSLALLPIAPFAVLAVLLAGFGLLGLSPYFLLVLSVMQARDLARTGREPGVATAPRTAVWGAFATVAATAWVLFLQPFFGGMVLPTVVGNPGVSARTEREAAERLRTFGGENAVLILCYRTPLPLWEQIGANASGVGEPLSLFGDSFRWLDDASVKQARRLYFLTTGKSYAQAPVPWTIANHRPEQWINDIVAEDVGGTRVGRNAPKLSLSEKRGTITVDAATATGTADITLTFANAADIASEARAEVLLPPGAVCDSVSLWINGEERRAAFGPQATVRRAYTEIAVVQRRDPLLVTMPVPGKLLVQCFPVPARGKMTIRLGATFPLLPDPSDRRKLSYALPAWGAVNFAGAGSLAQGLTLTDAATGKPPVFPLILPKGAAWHERAAARKPVNLLVALDTSAGMETMFDDEFQYAIKQAVRDLPPGSKVRYIGATTGGKPQSDLKSVLRFNAGQDNVPMLTAAVQASNTVFLLHQPVAGGGVRIPDTVLYLHAGTPDGVSDPAPLAEAVKDKPHGVRPRFVSLLLNPGEADAIGDRLAMQRAARAVSVSSYKSAGEAITATIDAIARESDAASLSTASTGSNGVRLRAYRDALAVWYTHNNFGGEALAAAREAARLRLVTPLSGAVVLETRADYEKHGLDDSTDNTKADAKKGDAEPTKDPSPTKLVTPESGTWLLILAGGGVVPIARHLHRRTPRRESRPDAL